MFARIASGGLSDSVSAFFFDVHLPVVRDVIYACVRIDLVVSELVDVRCDRSRPAFEVTGCEIRLVPGEEF